MVIIKYGAFRQEGNYHKKSLWLKIKHGLFLVRDSSIIMTLNMDVFRLHPLENTPCRRVVCQSFKYDSIAINQYKYIKDVSSRMNTVLEFPSRKCKEY